MSIRKTMADTVHDDLIFFIKEIDLGYASNTGDLGTIQREEISADLLGTIFPPFFIRLHGRTDR